MSTISVQVKVDNFLLKNSLRLKACHEIVEVPEQSSISTLLEIIGLNKNLIKPITSPELRQAAFRPRKLELSTRKLQRILGIVPLGIEEGLKIIKKQMEGKQWEF